MSLVNIGDVLVSKYRVDKILGIGGMGMVVAATHLELDQRVALKFMLPEALLSPQATDRFLREARAAVKLKGEHVCRVLDVGKLESGSPYIVMEFLEGEDFQHVLARRGYLTVPEAVEFIMQALEGLAEAHAAGIVHRDLKPGNLFVATDSDGSPLVKVLDFGISKSAGANATKTGEVMGSPAYMAPEQMMSAKDVDARADLWAIGVILYHATSGRVPFEHDNLAGLCMAVMNDAPAPLETLAPVPPAFAAVIARCMQKQRDHRYADVGELAAALAPFGTPDAVASAQRVAKVLRRVGMSSGSSAAIAVTMAPSGLDLPIARTPTPMPTPPPHPSNSTIGASAGEDRCRRHRRVRGRTRHGERWRRIRIATRRATSAGDGPPGQTRPCRATQGRGRDEARRDQTGRDQTGRARRDQARRDQARRVEADDEGHHDQAQDRDQEARRLRQREGRDQDGLDHDHRRRLRDHAARRLRIDLPGRQGEDHHRVSADDPEAGGLGLEPVTGDPHFTSVSVSVQPTHGSR
jgi:eukaryotic-like serine/threonine-protein kinase